MTLLTFSRTSDILKAMEMAVLCALEEGKKHTKRDPIFCFGLDTTVLSHHALWLLMNTDKKCHEMSGVVFWHHMKTGKFILAT